VRTRPGVRDHRSTAIVSSVPDGLVLQHVPAPWRAADSAGETSVPDHIPDGSRSRSRAFGSHARVEWFSLCELCQRSAMRVWILAALRRDLARFAPSALARFARRRCVWAKPPLSWRSCRRLMIFETVDNVSRWFRPIASSVTERGSEGRFLDQQGHEPVSSCARRHRHGGGSAPSGTGATTRCPAGQPS
jgi:hypothetical protein